MSIIERLQRGQNSEKKRDSGGADSTITDLEDAQDVVEASEPSAEENEDGMGPRSVFVNTPLPDDAVDENGHPVSHFKRNKIRTAKYTPLSFIPKNLFYQFHNIANIYFLFLIILTVSIAGPVSQTGSLIRR